MSSPKALLLDISGVLRDGDVAIPGSIQAFQRLKSSPIKVKLVTNESQVTREESLNKLLRLGYTGITLDDIAAPAPLLAERLKRENLKPHFLVHPKVIREFTNVGIPEKTEDPDCVVIGDAAEHFTYDAMNRAFRALLHMEKNGRPKTVFSLGKGKYYKEDDLLWMDVGPFCAGLEYAANTTAELVGKPASSFFLGALDDLGVKPQDAIMIGDDIWGDVEGAQKAGLRGFLVRTGKFRPEDEQHPSIKPDKIVDDLSHAVNDILSALGDS